MEKIRFPKFPQRRHRDVCNTSELFFFLNPCIYNPSSRKSQKFYIQKTFVRLSTSKIKFCKKSDSKSHATQSPLYISSRLNSPLIHLPDKIPKMKSFFQTLREIFYTRTLQLFSFLIPRIHVCVISFFSIAPQIDEKRRNRRSHNMFTNIRIKCQLITNTQ